jgi:PBP1b-binding outer membrane lipoprotein LpoB
MKKLIILIAFILIGCSVEYSTSTKFKISKTKNDTIYKNKSP